MNTFCDLTLWSVSFIYMVRFAFDLEKIFFLIIKPLTYTQNVSIITKSTLTISALITSTIFGPNNIRTRLSNHFFFYSSLFSSFCILHKNIYKMVVAIFILYNKQYRIHVGIYEHIKFRWRSKLS